MEQNGVQEHYEPGTGQQEIVEMTQRKAIKTLRRLRADYMVRFDHLIYGESNPDRETLEAYARAAIACGEAEITMGLRDDGEQTLSIADWFGEEEMGSWWQESHWRTKGRSCPHGRALLNLITNSPQKVTQAAIEPFQRDIDGSERMIRKSKRQIVTEERISISPLGYIRRLRRDLEFWETRLSNTQRVMEAISEIAAG